MKKVILIFLLILFGCNYNQDVTDNNDFLLLDTLRNDIYLINKNIISDEVILDIRVPSEDIVLSTRPKINKTFGTLSYKIDTLLIVDVTSRVEAMISRLSNDTISDYLVSISQKSYLGKVETTNIRVGNIMDMELVSLNSDAFNITKISPSDQPIEDDYIAKWIWGLTPLKTGTYNLILRAYIKDNNITRFENIFDKMILVENKPKSEFVYNIIMPNELKRFDKQLIKLSINKVDSDGLFLWGGQGKVVLEFDDIVDIKIDPNNHIDDTRTIFNYEWMVEPKTSKKVLKYTLKIIGDYEEIIVDTGEIKVNRNNIKRFNSFVDDAVKRWYWLFTILIIPLYNYIKKKYFKKKES